MDQSTERRLKNGLATFFASQPNLTPNQAKQLVPDGNSSRSYLIPIFLIDAFVAWYKEQEKNGFRSFDVKRKASVSADSMVSNTNSATKAAALPPPFGNPAKRIKMENSVNIPLEMTTSLVKGVDLELAKYKWYGVGLTCSLLPQTVNEEMTAEKRTKLVRSWLLIKMKERFPLCIIVNSDDDGSVHSSYGVPKQLQTYDLKFNMIVNS